MPSLLLCDYPTDTRSLCRELAIPDDCIRCHRGREPRSLSARVPYLLGACHEPWELDVCARLEPPGRMLTELCFDFGAPATLALSEIRQDLQRYGGYALTGLGSGAALYSSRISRFLEAMHEHQRNMLAYHRATRPGYVADTAAAAAAHSDLVRSGHELNRRFALELEAATNRLRPRQRTYTSDRRQMPELVRRARRAKQLDVRSPIEATQLVELARAAKYVGRGVVAVDLGMRVNRVHEQHEARGDWQRSAVTEAAGFVISGMAGVALTGAAVQTLNVIALATPAGWVLVLGGAALAGVITAGSILAGTGTEYVAGSIYDWTAERRKR